MDWPGSSKGMGGRSLACVVFLVCWFQRDGMWALLSIKIYKRGGIMGVIEALALQLNPSMASSLRRSGCQGGVHLRVYWTRPG